MNLTPQQIELLDQAIVRTLRDNNTIYGWPAPTIHNFVVAAGFRQITDEDIVFRCEYLTEKRLISEPFKEMHAANRAWKITSAGRQYLDERNL
jgi:hypothetical protein